MEARGAVEAVECPQTYRQCDDTWISAWGCRKDGLHGWLLGAVVFESVAVGIEELSSPPAEPLHVVYSLVLFWQ